VTENFLASSTFRELEGPRKVSFNPDWGEPENTIFKQLEDWTRHEEPGIKYYAVSLCTRNQLISQKSI